MSEISITLNELGILKHTLGFDQKKVKRGKYEAYRNHFYTNPSGSDGKLCEALFEKGLMKRRPEIQDPNKEIYYRVSESGIELLSKMLSVSITEVD